MCRQPRTLALGNPTSGQRASRSFPNPLAANLTRNPGHLCGHTGHVPSPAGVRQLPESLLMTGLSPVPQPGFPRCPQYRLLSGETNRAKGSFKSVVLCLGCPLKSPRKLAGARVPPPETAIIGRGYNLGTGLLSKLLGDAILCRKG